MNFRYTSRGLFRASQLQWQPTLTVHDPNPPITLGEEAAPPPPEGQFIQLGSANDNADPSTATLPGASTTGNAIIGWSIWGTQAITIVGVSDNKSNSYTVIGTPINIGSDRR